MNKKTREILLSVLTVAVLVPGLCLATDSPLPRKLGDRSKDESYPGVTLIYDSVRNAADQRLRLIVTHPDRSPSVAGQFPTIFVVGWLSCDTVEAPPGTIDGTQRMLQAIVRTPGFATVRLDKAGVGDSDGDCSQTDFTSELDAYRRAFKHISNYRFVDHARIFLFGISNGGGFAPLVAQGAPVKGYVVDGGWIKTWFEHMLEIERRLALSGIPPAEITSPMKAVESCTQPT